MARTFVADVEKQIQKKQEKLLILQEQIDIIGKLKNVRSPVKLSVTLLRHLL